LLFAAALVALLVPLAEGQAEGWPAWTGVALACAPFLAFLTISYERRFENSGQVPLLPPSLLSIRSMRRGLVLQLLFMLGYGAFMFVFALTIQDGLHADPLHSGIAITPMALAFFVASLLTPTITERFGARRTIAVGATVNVIGLIGLILTVAGSWPHVNLLSLAPSLVVTGFGQAFVFVSLFRVVLTNVPPHHAGVGGGVLVTIQQSGLAVGVATLGTLYLSYDTASISEAFAVTTAAEAALLAVIAISSRFVHADQGQPKRPPIDQSCTGTHPRKDGQGGAAAESRRSRRSRTRKKLPSGPVVTVHPAVDVCPSPTPEQRRAS
jgi:hypothetical protein